MIRKIRTATNATQKEAWIALLNKEGIKPEETLDETFGLYEDGVLVATASRYQNVIKCVAVDSDYQGGSLFNEIISHVMNKNVENNYFQHYVYTKPESKKAFEFLGFKEIESVDNKLVFMEKAIRGFQDYLKKLEKEKVNEENIAAIVMNANPFTLGHQYLVTKASEENDWVYLFVLTEDMSAFDTQTRTALVKAGTAHLKNVKVVPTGNYIISNATFPSYFLKEDDDVTKIQAKLDAKIFADHIAPVLNIKRRYVGSEPFSPSTNIYNEAMQEVFNNKLELIIVDRIGNEAEIISATKVRNFLIADQIDIVKSYVPETTFDFLKSDQGQAIIKRMKENAKQ